MYKRVSFLYINSEGLQRSQVVEWLFNGFESSISLGIVRFGPLFGVYARKRSLVQKGYILSVILDWSLRWAKQLLLVEDTQALPIVKGKVLLICNWWDQESIHSSSLQ